MISKPTWLNSNGILEHTTLVHPPFPTLRLATPTLIEIAAHMSQPPLEWLILTRPLEPGRDMLNRMAVTPTNKYMAQPVRPKARGSVREQIPVVTARSRSRSRPKPPRKGSRSPRPPRRGGQYGHHLAKPNPSGHSFKGFGKVLLKLYQVPPAEGSVAQTRHSQ